MFVRPVEDTKSFDGAVFSLEEFEELRMGDASIRQVRVSASPVRTIMREYRLFFVGGASLQVRSIVRAARSF